MNCPKCNFEINEKMLVCPNCKKVLKLVCPKCNTINDSNLCKKCGFTIIIKCHQCGKINQTINEICAKCGFSTYSSVAIKTSNIDEFACITIDFPNVSDIKTALGSTKLFEKFKANLDRLVLHYARENDLTREIIDGSYVIRFNKSSSMLESATAAVNGAIEILNSVTELNFKLNELKNILLQCNIAVLKRNINSKPEDYKSGYDVKLIYQGKNQNRLLNGLQVITDSAIYEQVCDKFELSTLSSTFIKGQTVMFFELNIKKYVKIPKPKENEDVQDLAQLPVFEEEEIQTESDLYDVNAINFEELSVSFINTESANVIPQVLSKLQENPLNLIAIKSKKEFASPTNRFIKSIKKLNRFANVFSVTCNDNMKYEPYGFFRELLLDICNFAVAPRNFRANNFEMFNAIDPHSYMKNLINLQIKENSNPDEVRNLLFDVFFDIFASLSGSLIYIEDFDKIDDASYEILQMFFEKFEEFKISYVVTTSEDFSLHKDAHFLLSNKFYTNITVKPSSFKDIIAQNTKRYSSVLKSYGLEKISQNFKGSFLFFNQAIDYLIDSEYFSLESDGALNFSSQSNIFVPTSLDALITKRLKNLSKEKEAYKLFLMLLLIGPRIDLATIGLLEIREAKNEIKKLVERNYIFLNDTPGEEALFVNNYNLFKENLLNNSDLEALEPIAKELLEKIFVPQIPAPAKSLLYGILKMEKEEINNWESLSILNSTLSDFNAYLNCGDNILNLIEEKTEEDLEKNPEIYKTEIYENVSTLLHKFSPEKADNITQLILDRLAKSTDDEQIFRMCNKMLQGCLIEGNYTYAFELIHKVLSRFTNASVNPANPGFNISYFLVTLLKIEVLFGIGNLKNCVDIGEEVLNSLSLENVSRIKPEHLSSQQFEQIIFDAMSFVAISKIILLNPDLNQFIQKLQTNIGTPPKIYEAYPILEQLIRGQEEIQVPSSLQIYDDKFSKIIINILKAFGENKNDYKEFADDFHQAKIGAKMNKILPIELMCDLLIGYSYFKLQKYKKALNIYNNVLEVSTRSGLKQITYLDWYLISVLKFEQQDIEVSFGLTRNAIVQLEKDSNSGDYLFFLFQMLLSKILTAKNQRELAESCLNNAKFIKEKYKLKYDTNIDLSLVEAHEKQDINNTEKIN